jgi:hypothetical protein
VVAARRTQIHQALARTAAPAAGIPSALLHLYRTRCAERGECHVKKEKSSDADAEGGSITVGTHQHVRHCLRLRHAMRVRCEAGRLHGWAVHLQIRENLRGGVLLK